MGFLIIIVMGLNLLLPILLAVMGYLTIFYEFDWQYLLAAVVCFVITTSIITRTANPEVKYATYYRLTGGAIGWVWMLSIPASIWFLISAILFDESWMQFGYSFLVGGVAKGLGRAFMQSEMELNQETPSQIPVVDIDEKTMDIIGDFGKCMMNNDVMIAFYDEKTLPHKKETILKALVSGINQTSNNKIRDTLKAGLIALPSFQKRIGEKPIYKSAVSQMQAEGFSPSNVTDKNMENVVNRYAEISKKNEKRIEKLQNKYFEELESYLSEIQDDKLKDMIRSQVKK